MFTVLTMSVPNMFNRASGYYISASRYIYPGYSLDFICCALVNIPTIAATESIKVAAE